METPPQTAPSPTAGSRRRALLLGASAVVLGSLIGLGLVAFGYGGGTAYLGSDPATCANCHVMEEHFASWVKSSHHGVATCNDCHLSPHPIGRWVTKADNGFFHSLAFTTGDYPYPLRIKPRNRRVTQDACLHCHGDFVHPQIQPDAPATTPRCSRCHSQVGHAGR